MAIMQLSLPSLLIIFIALSFLYIICILNLMLNPQGNSTWKHNVKFSNLWPLKTQKQQQQKAETQNLISYIYKMGHKVGIQLMIIWSHATHI